MAGRGVDASALASLRAAGVTQALAAGEGPGVALSSTGLNAVPLVGGGAVSGADDDGTDTRPWEPRAIIDFADAKAGDPLYDLVALHLACFSCDKARLRAFLVAYCGGEGGATLDDPAVAAKFERRFGPRDTFARRAMWLTLLHRCDALRAVFRGTAALPKARLARAASWEELETLVWDLDAAPEQQPKEKNAKAPTATGTWVEMPTATATPIVQQAIAAPAVAVATAVPSMPTVTAVPFYGGVAPACMPVAQAVFVAAAQPSRVD